MDRERRNYREMDTDELYQLAAHKGIMNVSSNDRESLIRNLENEDGGAATESSRLEGKSMEELLAIAEERGVRNRNELPKPQLISAILTAGEERSATEQNPVHHSEHRGENLRERMVDRTLGSKS